MKEIQGIPINTEYKPGKDEITSLYLSSNPDKLPDMIKEQMRGAGINEYFICEIISRPAYIGGFVIAYPNFQTQSKQLNDYQN